MRRQAVAGMVTLALLLLMASDTMLAAAPPDIRNVRWGMTPSEVMVAEMETELAKSGSSPDTLIGRVEIAGHQTSLLYHFEAGRLVEVIYVLMTEHSSPNRYI